MWSFDYFLRKINVISAIENNQFLIWKIRGGDKVYQSSLFSEAIKV